MRRVEEEPIAGAAGKVLQKAYEMVRRLGAGTFERVTAIDCWL